jgi:hypothetical protein
LLPHYSKTLNIIKDEIAKLQKKLEPPEKQIDMLLNEKKRIEQKFKDEELFIR